MIHLSLMFYNKNRFALISVLLLQFFPICMLAQPEKWDVYTASYEKGVGSVIINLSAKNYAPVNSLPYLVITGVKFKGCTVDGFPDKDAFIQLYAISDSIKAAIGGSVKNNMVGTFTYQCSRKDYYYVSDTTGLRILLDNVFRKYFKVYEAIINIKEDRKWEIYRTGLYPNEITLEFMANDKVLSKLTEAGDKLEKERKVDHWIYFSSENDRDCFINYVIQKNFKIENKDKVSNGMRPYKLQISRVDKVDIGSISRNTLNLRKEAAKCHGEYDGWETFVIKE